MRSYNSWKKSLDPNLCCWTPSIIFFKLHHITSHCFFNLSNMKIMFHVRDSSTNKMWSNSTLFQLSLNMILSVLDQKAKDFPCLFLSLCMFYIKKQKNEQKRRININKILILVFLLYVEFFGSPFTLIYSLLNTVIIGLASYPILSNMLHSLAYMYMTVVILLNYHNQIEEFHFVFSWQEGRRKMFYTDWLAHLMCLFLWSLASRLPTVVLKGGLKSWNHST